MANKARQHTQNTLQMLYSAQHTDKQCIDATHRASTADAPRGF